MPEKKKTAKSMSPERKLLISTVVVSSIFVIIGIVSGDKGVFGNSIILSVFLISIPQFLFGYGRYKELKEYEETFPLFLRDVIENIRSGSPFHTAIQAVSKIEYGKLSKEIKKMSNQISWGMPFDKVIEQFANRVKKSRRLSTGLKTIEETYKSGGDVVRILESLADSSLSLQESYKERKSLLQQYVVLMYAISFIFVGIVVAINKLMVPIFQTQGPAGEVLGISNPCLGSADFICNIYSLPSKYIFGIDPNSIGAYYTSLFFMMSIIVSFSNGLVAGQISENSALSGLKHSLIMVVTTFGSFFLLISLNLLSV